MRAAEQVLEIAQDFQAGRQRTAQKIANACIDSLIQAAGENGHHSVTMSLEHIIDIEYLDHTTLRMIRRALRNEGLSLHYAHRLKELRVSVNRRHSANQEEN